jgi:hypothetical protein
MNLVRFLNAAGILLSLFGGITMLSNATRGKIDYFWKDPDTTWGDVYSLNKTARNNAIIVIVGGILQLIAALLDS